MTEPVSELEKITVQEVTVTLGGETHRLVFGMKAAKVLQQEYGTLAKAMDRLSAMSETGLDVSTVESLLFALLSIDKTVTREKVTEWIEAIESIADGKSIFDALGQAIRNGAPVASGDPTTPTKK